MSQAKSPVEQRIEQLAALWIEASADPELRILVWRAPGNAERLLAAFFEANKQLETALTPDCFLGFDQDFETGFSYSRTLLDSLQQGFVESRDMLKQQGLPVDWSGAHGDWPDSAAGVMRMFGSFAEHYQAHMRHFVPVLTPSRVTDADALRCWVEAALRAPVPGRVRLALVDNSENPRWQALLERHPRQVRVIEAPIDMFEVARSTAAQAGGAGPTVAYRQMLADTMLLLEKGSAAQTAKRADRALAIAEREQWPDQQVVLHMMVAGAHLKQREIPEAIARYRRARDAAMQAEAAGHPAGSNLVVQAWFGEAGAWLTANQPERAAQAYAEGAAAARRIPHPMFALEGLRMAGFCQVRAGHREAARQHYLEAIAEARPMPPAERGLTTLPLLLQDMLRLQDEVRTARIEKIAADYQTRIAEAHADAEVRAVRLGDTPAPAALERIEDDMHACFEIAFDQAFEARERLISGGDDYFRKVIAIGRDYLHDRWNGLPDIRHPLDREQAQWRTPPEFAQLPDPSELQMPAPAAAVVES